MKTEESQMVSFAKAGGACTRFYAIWGFIKTPMQ